MYWDINIQFADTNEGVSEEGVNLKNRKGKGKKELCRPKSTSLNQFCPNVESVDVVNGIGRVCEGDNPLFWPFPLQGRPLLDVENLLGRGGFKILP